MLDEIIDLSFPSLNYIVNLQKTFYFTFHRSCFLTFKYLTRLIVTSIALFLQIPFATLWYFQLVISLSNDVSENPGPPFTTASDGASPYFSFCNWNLNTLSKDDFSRVSLLDAHNSIHKYDIISCVKRVCLKMNMYPKISFKAITIMHVTIPVERKRVGWVFFIKTRCHSK